MKLRFKKQEFQSRAVSSVVDCFRGQPNSGGVKYRIDPGTQKRDSRGYTQTSHLEASGFKNEKIFISE